MLENCTPHSPVGSLLLTPHLSPCWGLRHRAECREEKETKPGGRGGLGVGGGFKG